MYIPGRPYVFFPFEIFLSYPVLTVKTLKLMGVAGPLLLLTPLNSFAHFVLQLRPWLL